MRIEIDQSGKIEQTNLVTVIALTNDVSHSILLLKKTKRALQEMFKKGGNPRMFVYTTFAALIAIILYEARPVRKVFIDDEYLGHKDLIKKQIVEFLMKMKTKKMPDFDFDLIGKSSPAHILATKVAHKKIEPSKVVSLKEIKGIVWGNKK